MAGHRLRLVAIALAIAVCERTHPEASAIAQTPQELDDARKLFTDALKDEQEKRYADALEKFRRVQRVRDTIAIRYRIATCLEGMRKLRDAQVAFATLAGEPKATGDDLDTVKSAASHASDLAARIPRLTLRLATSATAVEVRIDDQVVAHEALVSSIALDPGDHVVDASGGGIAPFHTRITLDERARVELTIPIGAAPTPSASASTSAPAPSVSASAAAPSSSAPDEAARTWGTVAIAGGGVLVGASLITYLLRHGDIAELNRSCPGGACQPSREPELTSIRQRALVEGPLAIGFGIAGVAAAGVGLYLIVSSPNASSPKKSALSVSIDADGVVRLRGSF